MRWKAASCGQNITPANFARVPALFSRPALLPAGTRIRQQLDRAKPRRVPATTAAATAAVTAFGMATNGLTALLRDFRLTLPEGADPTAPLVVRQTAHV